MLDVSSFDIHKETVFLSSIDSVLGFISPFFLSEWKAFETGQDGRERFLNDGQASFPTTQI